MSILDDPVEPAARISNVEGFNEVALLKFDRIDRLRILLGATWCDCGCGLLDRTPYRTLVDLSKLPLGTLNKLAGSGRVYITTDKLVGLCKIAHVPATYILNVLNLRETPSKENACP